VLHGLDVINTMVNSIRARISDHGYTSDRQLRVSMSRWNVADHGQSWLVG